MTRPDRRQFVAGSAVAAGALALGLTPGGVLVGRADEGPVGLKDAPRPAGTGTPAPFKKAVKIGMVKIEGDLTAKLTTLAELGYDGIELDGPGSFTAEEVKRAIDASGIPVHGVVDNRHWKETLSDPDPAVREKGREALIGAIAAAKSYGATSVLLVPGVVKGPVTYQECWDRSIVEIKKVLPIAGEQGIAILIENVWNDFLTSAEDFARYLDDIGSDLVGAYFDIGNVVKYGPPEAWIPTLGTRIKKLDVKGYGQEKGFKHTILDGDIDWPAVVKELKKLNYSGWATAEVAGGDREYLASIASMMDKALAG